MFEKYNLTFGADPEYFAVEIIDGEEYGVPVPYYIEKMGVPEIGFDPTRKHPVLTKQDQFKIIMDGIAAEFTLPPVKTAQEMFNNVHSGLSWLDNFANQFGHTISVKPTVKYDFWKYFDPEIETLAWCGIFGCDPDRDAIMENYESPEIDVKNHSYRYGGGHLHISDNNVLIKDLPIPFIRILALTCGNYSVGHSPYRELEEKRMFKYGLPGRFRVQNYPDGNIGVEYRSPSNVWSSDLGLTEGMFYWAEKAYDYLNHPEKAIQILDTWLDETVDAITTVNQEKANYILSKI